MRETIVDRAYAKTLLPPRKEDGHKGDFGKLLVLGGSVGYTGAPYLAASAAVHSGCGLVYLGVPESIWAVEAQKCVSAMPFPLPETDGRLCLAALDKMQDKLKGCDVLALGPGLGRGKETEQLVHALADIPIVLTARRDIFQILPGSHVSVYDRAFREISYLYRISAADDYFALVLGYHVGDDIHSGGLAAAVPPEESVHRSPADIHVKSAQNRKRAVFFV